MGRNAVCQLLAFGLLYFVLVDVSDSTKEQQRQQAVVNFDLPQSAQRAVSTQTVSAQCTEAAVIVSIDPDLLGIQHPVQPSDLSIGGCGVTRQVTSPPEFVIEAPLQGCGSTVTMLADDIVYSFTLEYNPSQIPGIPIIRTNAAAVLIECHYPRRHNVSSNALDPTWIPYTSTKSAEDVLGFSLVIMNSDWSAPRSTNLFYLGDLINLQASVGNSNHVPLRLFVDKCVASQALGFSSQNYTFIGNSGCLTDSKLTGSNSQFITPRNTQSTLQFELDAFRFYGNGGSSIYITCRLKVTLASRNIDSLNKACTYIQRLNQWKSVDGNDQVCSCCNTNCAANLPGRRYLDQFNIKQRRSVKMPAEWDDTIVVGPLLLKREPPPIESRYLTNAEETSSGSSLQAEILGAVLGVLALACCAFFFLYRKPN
uniref:Zona pellucida sperm-binding protein 3 n=1 Tax=Erpetoichthys calabaricus TaxID=27687 RepID=A0A8C4SHA6_ERPCA